MRHGHDVNIRMTPCKFYFQYSGTSLKMATERKCDTLVRFLLSHHANPNIAGPCKKLATPSLSYYVFVILLHISTNAHERITGP